MNYFLATNEQHKSSRILELVKTLGVFLLSCFYFPLSVHAESCAKATTSGTSCRFLKVELDLSACPEKKQKETAKILNCSDTAATAQVQVADGHYIVNVKGSEGTAGETNWSVADIRKEKKEKPKEKVKVKEAAVTPPPTPPVTSAPVAAAAPTPVPTPTSVTPPPAATAAAAPPTPALADRVSLKGQFRLRTERNDYTDYVGIKTPTLLRVRPTITVKASPEFDLVFEPQFARTFGETTVVGRNTTASATVTQNQVQKSSGTTVDPSLSVHQAYGNYRPEEWVSLYLGRQILSYGNELVVGALEWNNVGRSFDAVRGRFTYQGFLNGWTDVFAAKLVHNDEGGATTGSGDIDLDGIYNSWNFGTYFNAVDLYYLYRNDRNTAVTGVVNPEYQLHTYGLRLASSFSGIDYRIEGTGQARRPTNNRAYQYNAEVGYTFDSSMKPRFALEFAEAGANYDQLYPTAHKWLGYADVFGRRNIRDYAAHASITAFTKWTFQLDYHHFTRTSSDTPAYKIDGTTALGSATTSNSMDLGSETDLTITYAVNKGLNFSGGASVLNQGSYLTDNFNQKNPIFAFLQMSAGF